MIDFNIREASEEDWETIKNLLIKFDLYLGDTDKRYIHNYLVAVDKNEKIVGCDKHIIQENKIFRIKSLAVSEEHRRKRIGTILVLSQIERAKEKGFTKVYIGVMKDNYGMVDLLKKLGFNRMDQEEYTIFPECRRCTPDFLNVNKWPYCRTHSEEGECPKYFYKQNI